MTRLLAWTNDAWPITYVGKDKIKKRLKELIN
jgi:hypothetical protein